MHGWTPSLSNLLEAAAVAFYLIEMHFLYFIISFTSILFLFLFLFFFILFCSFYQQKLHLKIKRLKDRMPTRIFLPESLQTVYIRADLHVSLTCTYQIYGNLQIKNLQPFFKYHLT